MIVEREIVIDAPPDVVWDVVTEPEQIRRWFAEDVDIDVRPGGTGTLVFSGPHHDQPTTVPLRVEQVRPPELFSYRWVYPDGAEPSATNSVLVEFTLHAEGPGTRLRVTESGLDALDWSADEKADYVEKHTDSWATYFSRLREYVGSEPS